MFGLISRKRYDNLLKSFQSLEADYKEREKKLQDDCCKESFNVKHWESRYYKILNINNMTEKKNKELEAELEVLTEKYHKLLSNKITTYVAASEFVNTRLK